MDIGTIITKYCDEHGMSSTEFANRVGVSRAYIYMAKNLGFKPKNQCSIASAYI